MRPEGRLRAGFYSCPREAIEALLKVLRPPADGPVSLLDPCAGEGEAILQIAAGLGLDDKSVWLIELDRTRGDRCRELMPQATILSPCSYLSSSIRYGAFSLIYCNPPFDDSAKKGVRVEEQFLSRITHQLADDGLLIFVCPEPVTQRMEFRNMITTWYTDCSIVEWPSKVRKYKECFFIARRRESDLEKKDWWDVFDHRRQGHYRVPNAKGPGKTFTKVGFTEEELIEALKQSPLNSRLVTAPEHQLPAPPLALNVGHLALLLAAGHLDGLVCPPGEMPHVVRGVAKKVPEVTDQTVDKDEKCKKTTTIITEKIKLTIRAVWPDGVIHTLGDQEPVAEEAAVP